MSFSKQELQQQLNRRGRAAEVVVLPQTDSTNLQARALCGSLCGNFLVAANSQTAGRGSHGRSFFSPQGGFYLTAALRSVSPAVPLTAAAGVAAVQALQRVCGRTVSIKWVNDLRFAGKKVCGILCERTADGSVLVGIGINLQPPEGGFPPEIAEIAGALDVSPRCSSELAAEFYHRLLALTEQPETILPAYRAHCETLGQEITFLQGGERLFGRAVSVEENAALLVRLRDGRQILLQSGEASVRPAAEFLGE